MKVEKLHTLIETNGILGQHIKDHLYIFSPPGSDSYKKEVEKVRYIAFRPFEGLDFEDGDYRTEEIVHVMKEVKGRATLFSFVPVRWNRVTHSYYFAYKKGDPGEKTMHGFDGSTIREALAQIAGFENMYKNPPTHIWPTHVIRKTIIGNAVDGKLPQTANESMMDVFRFPSNFSVPVPERT